MGISAGIGGGKIPTLQVEVPEVIQSKARSYATLDLPDGKDMPCTLAHAHETPTKLTTVRTMTATTPFLILETF